MQFDCEYKQVDNKVLIKLWLYTTVTHEYYFI